MIKLSKSIKSATKFFTRLSVASIVSPIVLSFTATILIPSLNSNAYATDPTLSITPISNLNLNMAPAAGINGSFGVASTNVTVSTDNITGYTFTMNTQTTNTDLTSSRIDYTDPTKANLKITNLAASTAQANFSPNKWGYNVSKNNGGSGNNNIVYLKGAANTYLPVPNSGSSYSDKQIEVTSGIGSNTYTFNYGVKANNNLPAGEYANTLVFSVIANIVPEPVDCSTSNCTIIYNNNFATSHYGIAATHPNVTVGSTIDLFPGNDYKLGHGFAGWSTDSDAGTKIASSDANIRNSVKVYGPMETVTVDNTLLSTNLGGTITLYAVWVPAPTANGNNSNNIDNLATLQDFDTTACTNLAQTTYDATTQTITPGQITARKDSRDDNTYAIARLADGNCWMMENLRLDNTAAELTAANTNNPAISNLPASSSDWCNDGTPDCRNTAKIRTDNTALTTSLITSSNQNIYSYGNYYNWFTATAGTRTSGAGDANGSICPYSWLLPNSSGRGNINRQFDNLSISYGGTGYRQTDILLNNRFRTFPNNYIFSGAVQQTYIFEKGADGSYWPNTASSETGALLFGLSNQGDVKPFEYGINKTSGHSIRCLVNQ